MRKKLSTTFGPLKRLAGLVLLSTVLMASDCEFEMPEPPVTNTNGGGGGGSNVCGSSYNSPVNDAQLDSFCGAAYAYRCLDGLSVTSQQVQSVCEIYNSIKEPSAPSCPYCQ